MITQNSAGPRHVATAHFYGRVGAACLLAFAFAIALSSPARAFARELAVATLFSAPVAEEGSTAARSEARASSALNEALALEICRRAGARCTLHALPFADLLAGVEQGRYALGLGNVLHTSERAQRLLFSQPLWRSSSRLIGSQAAIRAQAPKNAGELRPEALRDARLAVVRGTQQARYMAALAATGNLQIAEFATLAECLAAVRSGRADFSLLPVRGAWFQLAANTADDPAFVGPALAADGLGGSVHAILPKSEEKLLAAVNAALDAMRADGTFQRIVRRHLPFLAD